jgi:hypothetical protein
MSIENSKNRDEKTNGEGRKKGFVGCFSGVQGKYPVLN